MPRSPLAILLPVLTLGAGVAACAPAYDPSLYAAPAYVPAPAGYGAPYAAPMPAYVGQGETDARPVPAYAAAPTVADPYCREAYAAAAGAQHQAAITGRYEDAARAARSAAFFRRDC